MTAVNGRTARAAVVLGLTALVSLAGCSDEPQLTLIVVQQLVAHYSNPLMSTAPEVNSSVVSKDTGSTMGSIF